MRFLSRNDLLWSPRARTFVPGPQLVLGLSSCKHRRLVKGLNLLVSAFLMLRIVELLLTSCHDCIFCVKSRPIPSHLFEYESPIAAATFNLDIDEPQTCEDVL